ncbi:MAG TPA: ABC transporter permease [Bryobacteraceae bacterium]|nr:ABC transporter permease [Bryobacteraceae bacterium]
MPFIEDLRFALRTLRKNPGFFLTAMLALALGIGANSAMFSVIDGVLLRPLPFAHPERLVNVWETNFVRNLPQFPVAPANYYDWRKQNKVFSALGAYQGSTFNIATNDGAPERYVGVICDRGFFDTLQVSPLLGRLFTEEEEQAGRDGVLLLSYGVWRQRLGGDPSIIGQTLTVDAKPRTVIGVMPEGFQYPPLATMWAPLGFDNEARERRDYHRFRVIARLKNDVPLDRARSDFQALGARLAQAYPEFNKDEGVAVNLLLDDTVGKLRSTLLILLGAVAFVLLIACANVANLLLAKAAGRQREIAIRSSLGAGRRRIFSQMLTESVVLAFAGGLAGLLFTAAALRALMALAPANLPRVNEVALDWRVVWFTLLISVLTGLLFGLAPAWHTSRTDLNSLLKEGSRGAGSRSRLRSALIVGQVSAALILLAGAALLMRSFYEIEHVDAGFDPEHVMSMQLAPALPKYRGHPELEVQLARTIRHQLSALPGVQSVGITTSLPLLGNPLFIMRFEGRPSVTPSQAPVVNYFAVTPGYFDAMGMRVLRGRAISDRDTAATPPVVVVNRSLVDRYFPGQNPIGKRLEIGFRTPPDWREIIGVVADVHTAGLDQDTPVQAYVAYYQHPDALGLGTPSPITVVARTSGNPAALGETIKSAILRVDRAQPVFAMQPLTAVVAQSISQRRFSLVLLAFFAASALFLAALGLYGVMSYVVAQRTAEIGIRMALGARPSQVLLLVQRQGLLLVLVGLAIGLTGGLWLTRLMSSLLFHVDPADPLALTAGALTLLFVSLPACYLPARRAARVDPLIALRYD